MALLTVTEAARLARRSRASIYRDLEKGRLEKVFTADGALKIDSAALARAYGQIGRREEPGAPGASPAATDMAIQAVLRQVDGAAPVAGQVAGQVAESAEMAVLRERLAACEHRIVLLERIAQLEKAARQAADVTWRARLQGKEEVISALTMALARPEPQPLPQPRALPQLPGLPRDDAWPTWHHTPGGEKRAIN
ncbi:hypothetical protein [Pseudoduganella umbonata]|uniref:Helix-turn-helix domain-containing protein n=1 Tax=Pseudoduganella umbonata TaxID=864828 RepID=A0A4P8HJ67_9BURK|nr:hypothetical protein [Pseudoduganella umbonata]MBB3219509.1 hypothetical protein [Pseudoduganella umbonata]QCP09587.1 hypothetical protein FCL38_03495 [Pseudoduganella umbonata]